MVDNSYPCPVMISWIFKRIKDLCRSVKLSTCTQFQVLELACCTSSRSSAFHLLGMYSSDNILVIISGLCFNKWPHHYLLFLEAKASWLMSVYLWHYCIYEPSLVPYSREDSDRHMSYTSLYLFQLHKKWLI